MKSKSWDYPTNASQHPKHRSCTAKPSQAENNAQSLPSNSKHYHPASIPKADPPNVTDAILSVLKIKSKTHEQQNLQNCVNELNTLHVEAKVINPVYEEVKVDLKVKFHKGLDESFPPFSLVGTSFVRLPAYPAVSGCNPSPGQPPAGQIPDLYITES